MSAAIPSSRSSTIGMCEPDFSPPRRICVDLTLWIDKWGRPTGVPRVVLEVVRRCRGRSPAGVPLRRAIFLRGHWRDVTMVPDWAMDVIRATRAGARALGAEAARAASSGRALRAAWLRVGHHGFRLAASLARRLLGLCPRLSLTAGDTVLSLDMQSAALPGLSAAVARGASVVSVLYDCMPLTHPELFPFPSMLESHQAWHNWVSQHATGILSISETSMREARRLMPASSCWHAWFHLGGDLPLADPSALRPELREALSRPGFLMVGTVEPRKNHALAVAAMERAWARGCHASLVILGGEGWNNRDVLERIARLRAAGKPVLVIHDAGDDELAAAYREARALIAASVAEGYGLPVAEAGACGLPVLASDIPIFREVAPSTAAFFPPGDVDALTRLVERFSAMPFSRMPCGKALSWDASVRRLLELVESGGRPPAGGS